MWATSWYRSEARVWRGRLLPHPARTAQTVSANLRMPTAACIISCLSRPLARVPVMRPAFASPHTCQTHICLEPLACAPIARTDRTASIRLTTHTYQTPICSGLLPGASLSPEPRVSHAFASHLTSPICCDLHLCALQFPHHEVPTVLCENT